MKKNTNNKVEMRGYWETIRIIKTSVYKSKQEYYSGSWREKHPETGNIPTFNADELRNITNIILR